MSSERRGEKQPARPSEARQSPQQPAAEPNAMLHCPNCSQRLESRSCKLRCDRCGYFMDCSDYY